MCATATPTYGLPDKDDDGNYIQPKQSDLQPVAFFSKKLKDSEAKAFCIYEKEAYACVWGLESCKTFITGSPHPVLVFTDNKALLWLKNHDEPGRLGRWQAQLNSYDMDLVHTSGIENRIADCLSRNAIGDVTGVKIPRIRRILAHSAPPSMPKALTQEQGIMDASYHENGVRYVVHRNGEMVQCEMVQCEGEALEEDAKKAYWENRYRQNGDRPVIVSGVNDLNLFSFVIAPRPPLRPHNTASLSRVHRVCGKVKSICSSFHNAMRAMVKIADGSVQFMLSLEAGPHMPWTDIHNHNTCHLSPLMIHWIRKMTFQEARLPWLLK